MRQRFRRRLLAWYDRAARDLPWRRTSDPYAIWVSEIMLQQTQVVSVVPYFERFLARFPTIAALAAAPEQEVLGCWEGLGYYRRARHLHRAARQLVAEHGGRLPNDPDVVGSLPGIGRYTAGAILSIAFDRRAPILEANTIRLYSRLTAFSGDPRGTAGRKRLWHVAELLLPRRGTGRFNQALMELGAEVCRMRAPLCGECPVQNFCAAYSRGLVRRIPRAPRRPQVEEVREAAVVVLRRGRFLLVRRGDRERWAGMWDFPRAGLDGLTEGPAIDKAIRAAVEKRTGIRVAPGARIAEIRHGVTRFRIHLTCYEAKYVRKVSDDSQPVPQQLWVAPEDAHRYPLPVAARRLAAIVLGRSQGR
jgi:A/G-specific adenine glycosylase